MDIIIETLDGRRIGLSHQVARIIAIPPVGSPRMESDRYASKLGRQIVSAAGSGVLLDLLAALVDHMADEDHAHLSAVWSPIAGDADDAEDEDDDPDGEDHIGDFERLYGSGSWDRCERAIKSVTKAHRGLTRSCVTRHQMLVQGIPTQMADSFLVLVVE